MDEDRPPCSFIVVPSEVLKLSLPSYRDCSGCFALQVESSPVQSELSDSFDTVPLVVLEPISSSMIEIGGERDSHMYQDGESSSVEACGLGERDCTSSILTVSTIETSSFWAAGEIDQIEATSVSGSMGECHASAIEVADCKTLGSCDVPKRLDNTQRSKSAQEALERSDDRYFTEGFVNVGKLPMIF